MISGLIGVYSKPSINKLEHSLSLIAMYSSKDVVYFNLFFLGVGLLHLFESIFLHLAFEVIAVGPRFIPLGLHKHTFQHAVL